MVNENKKNQVYAAVAGIVVGAGAAIAGAVALSDKKNQKKVNEVLSKAKGMIKEYSNNVEEQKAKGKEDVKNVANKVIKSAEQVTKAGKKEVKNL